jgi:HK97 family phage major capsid protein
MSQTDEIVIDDAVVDAVAKKVTDTMPAPASADEIAEKLADKIVEKTEKTTKKNIEDTQVKEARNLKSGLEALPKELRFAKGLKAFMSNDAKGIAEYNSYVDKAWGENLIDIEKANYQNVTTTADGGALVPDPEFIAEIDRLTDQYGVVARLADVRMTDRDSVTLLSGTNEISFTRTSEATAQNAQKLTYAAATQALDKYIATLVMTSEILEDSAINMFADATNQIAEARAKLFDQLVFSDSTYGFTAASASDTYKTLSVGSAITDFSADDAMNARYQVKSSARAGGRYFMHPSVWNRLRQTKADNATYGSLEYLFGGPGQSVTPNIDGIPVEMVDVLPEYGDITANEVFAVYGDLKKIKMHVKRLLETKVFDSGVVKDAGGSDINLITQDSFAMRATLRCVPQTRFEGAFCLIGTGTVS